MAAINIIKTEGVFYSNEYEDQYSLLIHQQFSQSMTPLDIHNVTYTDLGLRNSLVERGPGGVKEFSTYTGLNMVDSVRVDFVRKWFNYVYTDPNPENIGVWTQHEWMMYDNTIGLWKVEFKPLSIGKVGALRANQRSYVVTSLHALGSADPTLTAGVALLESHYASQIDSFLKYGTDDWYNAIINETDTTINSILNSQITFNGQTFTVKQGILLDLSIHL